MAGDYLIQIHAKDGIKAKEEKVFDDCRSLIEFIKAFGRSEPSDILNAHLPSRATDDERRQIRELGVSSN